MDHKQVPVLDYKTNVYSSKFIKLLLEGKNSFVSVFINKSSKNLNITENFLLCESLRLVIYSLCNQFPISWY